jgi:hypothetical protein
MQCISILNIYKSTMFLEEFVIDNLVRVLST